MFPMVLCLQCLWLARCLRAVTARATVNGTMQVQVRRRRMGMHARPWTERTRVWFVALLR
ncbi:MAG: hypothetical protein EA398_06100 [Deltaproteobacteria bacterium]|nr:MAG: hypothetical protein EA398_06100 [Deltaproteobacteria bacterium]